MRHLFRSIILALALVASTAQAAITQTMVTQAKLDFLRGETGITATYQTGVANTVYTVGTRIQAGTSCTGSTPCIYELTAAMSGNSTTTPTGTTTSADNGGTWTYREPACVYKMALYTSTATLDATTVGYSATNEVSGTGYTAGGAAVTFSAVAVSGTAAQLTMATITWTTATITARGSHLYCATKGGTTINRGIANWDFGSDKTSTAGDFTITSSAGVVAIN